MKDIHPRLQRRSSMIAVAVLAAVSLPALAAPPDRLEELRRQLAEQSARLDQLRDQLSEQEATIASLRDALDEEVLDQQRGGTATGTDQFVAAAEPQIKAQSVDDITSPPKPVGEAPKPQTRAPEVAQIFAEPTVLTQSGKFVLEPSVQTSYWASDRVSLIGYSVIPAILIGLVDVRRVKTTNAVGALTARYGFGNRFEFEVRAPYVYTSVDTVSREILTGSAFDNVFNAEGHGLGDVDATMRFQLNRGDYSKPFWIGWLRYRWHTGTDPFEVVTDCVTRCIGNTTGTGLPLELPTGSGFNAAQAGVTWLYASDPAVFFGGFSYLHNFPRDNLTRTLLVGEEEPLGEIAPGDIFGFNVGMGLALNEKASFSIGYDQSLIDKTQQNGVDVPGAVRTTLGTLSLGVSYRYNPTSTLNLSLGVGVTRDTPDVAFTIRTPLTF
ncbi:putative coiled-coil protein SlyX [Povalibacter uvarum]|uniref:Putative coiled-coil protein SlyX n=1 Tax=Povalibacter uvarum TaxID=732238 RepID=A0A841HS65_9GAMM|nr:hypothetical protein [Povalibacter uvarum]MBB6095149.1 putative coiled-coil protein SlyX [Povalibacter uvarum]